MRTLRQLCSQAACPVARHPFGTQHGQVLAAAPPAWRSVGGRVGTFGSVPGCLTGL
jgi:hypothetical protein